MAGSMALAACASDDNSGSGSAGSGSGKTGDLKIGLAYDTGGRGDKSFNDSRLRRGRGRHQGHGGKVARS